jgi:hypothetical protein
MVAEDTSRPERVKAPKMATPVFGKTLSPSVNRQVGTIAAFVYDHG